VYPTLVADGDREPVRLEHALEGVEHLGADPDGLGEAVGAGRCDHELLDVDVVVRVLPAVQDVHERHGQDAGRHAADVPVERKLKGNRGRVSAGERDRQDRVGPEFRLVLGPVERDQKLVDQHLVGGVEADDLGPDLLIDVRDRLLDPSAVVARLVPVPKLDGLVGAGRGAGGHRRPTEDTGIEEHIDFDRGIPAGIEDLSCQHVGDRGHDRSISMWGAGSRPSPAGRPELSTS
jgi:hypothetical protein